MARLVVNQSNDLITAQYKMSLLAKKVFAMAVAKLNPTGEILTSKFSISELMELLESEDRNLPRKIIEAADEIMHISLRFSNDKYEMVARMFSQVTVVKENRMIEIEFPSGLREGLLNLKSEYCSYLLNNIVKLKNPLHIRLFEILKSKMGIKDPQDQSKAHWSIFIDDLYYSLMLPSSYKNYYNLEKYFLKSAQVEISNKTGLRFKYEPIYQGNKVLKVRFFDMEYSEDNIGVPVEETLTTKIKPKDEPKEPVVKDTMNKDIETVYNHYLKTFLKTPKEYRLTPNRKAKIKARLKEFSLEDLLKAIDNVTLDKWEKRPEYRDLEKHIFKSFEATEKWINFETEPKKIAPIKPPSSKKQSLSSGMTPEGERLWWIEERQKPGGEERYQKYMKAKEEQENGYNISGL